MSESQGVLLSESRAVPKSPFHACLYVIDSEALKWNTPAFLNHMVLVHVGVICLSFQEDLDFKTGNRLVPLIVWLGPGWDHIAIGRGIKNSHIGEGFAWLRLASYFSWGVPVFDLEISFSKRLRAIYCKTMSTCISSVRRNPFEQIAWNEPSIVSRSVFSLRYRELLKKKNSKLGSEFLFPIAR